MPFHVAHPPGSYGWRIDTPGGPIEVGSEYFADTIAAFPEAATSAEYLNVARVLGLLSETPATKKLELEAINKAGLAKEQTSRK